MNFSIAVVRKVVHKDKEEPGKNGVYYYGFAEDLESRRTIFFQSTRRRRQVFLGPVQINSDVEDVPRRGDFIIGRSSTRDKKHAFRWWFFNTDGAVMALRNFVKAVTTNRVTTRSWKNMLLTVDGQVYDDLYVLATVIITRSWKQLVSPPESLPTHPTRREKGTNRRIKGVFLTTFAAEFAFFTCVLLEDPYLYQQYLDATVSTNTDMFTQDLIQNKLSRRNMERFLIDQSTHTFETKTNPVFCR